LAIPLGQTVIDLGAASGTNQIVPVPRIIVPQQLHHEHGQESS
jgi:hypothetical protein